MTDSWLETTGHRLATALTRFVAGNGAPGAVTVVGTEHDARVLSAGVVAPQFAEVVPSAHTRYDVASLTKIISTWGLAGLAVADGALELDKPLSSYLGSSSYPGSVVTARQILSHTSGLRAATRFDQYVGKGDDLAELILREELETEPGAQHRYINRGFILLGLALERILGSGLDVLARERLWRPWRMERTAFGPLPADEDVAPTERRLSGARPAWGVVHDENAGLMGGVAGHAGVFSTADDLTRFARAVIAAARAGTAFGRYVQESLTVHATESATRRGLAWILLPGRDVIYHHGFTGVSLYVSPGAGRFVVLLSNAVFVSRNRERLNGWRAEALRAIDDAG